MPFGLSWQRYSFLIICSCLSAVTGSQFVHWYYKPLDDLIDVLKEKDEKSKQEPLETYINRLHNIHESYVAYENRKKQY